MSKRKSIRDSSSLVPTERIERSILLIRGEKVMLDSDLANLYDVETRNLVQAVKRNLDRFPADFMFQLTVEELRQWRSQLVMSNLGATMGLRRPLPFNTSDPFEEKMPRLVVELHAQFTVSAKLKQAIKTNLTRQGYGG